MKERRIQPTYVTAGINEDVPLCAEDVEIKLGGAVVIPKAAVMLRWLPRPRLRFAGSPSALVLPGKVVAHGPMRMRGNGIITGFQESAGHAGVSREVWGSLLSLERKGNHRLVRVHFHLVNCGMCSTKNHRLELTGSAWRFTIDEAKNLQHLRRKLQAHGGYAITHCGLLERVDGKSFSTREADEALTGLNYFLSHIFGRWISTSLEVGYSRSGDTVWERWKSPRVSPWSEVNTWYSWHTHPVGDELVGLYSLFESRWLCPDWRQLLRYYVPWHIASHTPVAEPALVTGQIALEAAAKKWLFQHKQAFSKGKFDDLKAKGRIRELLQDMKVRPSIPRRLTALRKFSRENGWSNDGPEVLAKLRNAIEHVKLELFNSVPVQAWVEIKLLVMWYLDLAFLRVLGYNGTYLDRMKHFEVRQVPWAPRRRTQRTPPQT